MHDNNRYRKIKVRPTIVLHCFGIVKFWGISCVENIQNENGFKVGWQAENTCYLQDLYVDPEIRGTGAGRALIEAVYDAADAAGAKGVYWTTQHFNSQARQLYDRIGKLTPFIKYSRV